MLNLNILHATIYAQREKYEIQLLSGISINVKANFDFTILVWLTTGTLNNETIDNSIRHIMLDLPFLCILIHVG